MKVKVEILSGHLDGRTYSFGSSFILGRGKNNSLILNFDRFISKRHAEISLEKGECFIEDLGSSNGTFLDEQKITSKVSVGNGQIIRAGRTNLKITW